MRILFLSLISTVYLLLAASASAHHAFAAEFDINQPVTINGKVTRMEWTNPHAWLFVEGKVDKGNVESWSVELVGINDLLRLGWGRNKVKAGDEVNITGYRARNGTNTANAAAVKLSASGELLWESVAQSRAEGRERRSRD